MVIQNMLVLAVDMQDTRNPEQKAVTSQTVTLAASPEESARLSVAAAVGELRLLLKGQGDDSRVAHVNVRASDLDTPLGATPSTSPDADKTEAETRAGASSTPDLPAIPEEKEKEKDKVDDAKHDDAKEADEPDKSERPRKKPHVLRIISGGNVEKHVFRDEEDDEEEGIPAGRPVPSKTPPAKKDDRPAARKPEERKPTPPPGGGDGTGGRAGRTRRPQ